MPKLAWQSIVAAVVLFAGVWVVRCYGGSQYDRGRREAEAAHTDSVRKWVAHGADSVSKIADAAITGLARERDSVANLARDLATRATKADERARKALDQLNHLPNNLVSSLDPRVRASIDSLRVSNVDLQNVLAESRAQGDRLNRLIASDSAAIRLLQDSRDRWKAAYDTASTEIGQLKAMKTPKKPRFGFKAGFLSGAVVVLGALIAAVGLSH